MKSDEADSTVAQPRRKSNTDENTKTLSLGKTFEVSRNEVEHKTFFLFLGLPGKGAQVRSRPILVANETQLIHLYAIGFQNAPTAPKQKREGK